MHSLAARVTAFALANHDERDCWEKSVALSGILAWGDADAVAKGRGWIDRAVATQNDDGNLSYADGYDAPPGHIKSFTPTATLTASLGVPLLRYYERTRDGRYLQAADLQAGALMGTRRTSDGGFWARGEGPELWIDMVYLMAPFLALYGTIKRDRSYVDEAVRQFEVHVRRLVDTHTGLSRHAWCEVPNHFPQSTFWARGNGWLIAASVDLLELIGDHPGRTMIASVGVGALKAMARLQDRSGFFRHVLDGPSSKKEASATLIYSYVVSRAVRLGLLDESYLDGARRAFEVVAGSVAPSGMVPGVAVPPGGPGVPFGWTQFGQGFFLLAALEMASRASEH
ncbi:MAG: glycosyl hydrolase [Hyphomicrobiaceae bacterium]|nr:MAG: glycosyl hydrolase [Hyphomicrobiaceae bacterium]